MCSWHFTIRERNLIHSLCILVTEFNSSAIILAIIHIQNMMLWQVRLGLRDLLLTGFSVSVEAHHSEVVLVHCSWVCGNKVVVLPGGLWGSCSSWGYTFWCFTFSFYTPCFQRRYHCCDSFIPVHIPVINYPTNLLAEVKVLLFILHYPGVTTKPGLDHGLYYGLDLIMDSLIDCKNKTS